jgi:signal transduction histidine kinase
MSAAGLAWFLGTLWAPAVFLHRGPLAQLLISYPSGRLSSRLERVAVGAAYVYAAADSVAGNSYATIVFAVGLVALSVRRYLAATGPQRRARLASVAAAAAFGLVLLLSAIARLAGVGAGPAMLLGYDLTVCLIAIGLSADLLWGRWAQAAVTGLVVDLGEPAAGGMLRDRLARALGDPTLVVGYWLPEQGRYVDEAGRTVGLPAGDARRAVTPIEEGGRRVAVLVHDPAVLDDPVLLSAVGSAARLAVSNARLQAEVGTRVGELEASRRRIVEASDEQRSRLERELRDGAEGRLAHVAELLADCGEPLAEVRAAVDAARAELREFARGMHPATLTELGLKASVGELAGRSPIPVEVAVPAEELPGLGDPQPRRVAEEAAADQLVVRVVGLEEERLARRQDTELAGAAGLPEIDFRHPRPVRQEPVPVVVGHPHIRPHIRYCAPPAGPSSANPAIARNLQRIAA